jgi:myo-inositol-1(or 4)-monophosphatase
MSLKHELQVASELARVAGAIALDHFGKVERLTKTHAATTDEAVTHADRACQRAIVAGLEKAFPGDGVIGEEDDQGRGITNRTTDPLGRVWVIDPIDGTNNFISGLGNFAVCIGLLERGEPVVGVVYDVMRDQLYAAARGDGAAINGRAVRAPLTPMSDASVLMITSNLLGPGGRAPGWAQRWLGQTHWKLRMLGSAALEAVSVAAGIAHGAITVNGKLWDAAAACAIVLESGGVVSDLEGKPVFPFDLRHYAGAKVPFLAAGRNAHARLLEEIRGNR